jgi:hypothetical protein
MHAGSENCRSNRCARTLRNGEGETTNYPVTPGIPRTHCHSVLKRGQFRADFSSFRFILAFYLAFSDSRVPGHNSASSLTGVYASRTTRIVSGGSSTLQLDEGIGDASVLRHVKWSARRPLSMFLICTLMLADTFVQ